MKITNGESVIKHLLFVLTKYLCYLGYIVIASAALFITKLGAKAYVLKLEAPPETVFPILITAFILAAYGFFKLMAFFNKT